MKVVIANERLSSSSAERFVIVELRMSGRRSCEGDDSKSKVMNRINY